MQSIAIGRAMLLRDQLSSLIDDLGRMVIDLPNAVTWFYFSALLAVALFVKFTRLLSIRNLDVLALFLPTTKEHS